MFTFALKFAASCPRHRGYTPPADGAGGIRGGCPRCHAMHAVWTAYLALQRAIVEYQRTRTEAAKGAGA